ncbi:MAG: hypothetical protein IRY98_13105 [Alicyclobacillaceae bacterium]|nr:hypothetical protein [Alicyclobacillaceae bacterium]
MPPPRREGDFTLEERLIHEYSWLQVGLSGHWMDLFRPRLQKRGVFAIRDLAYAEGHDVWVAGLPVRPHRPPTPSGKTVVFFSLEDETGMVDAVMFEEDYLRRGGDLFRPGVTVLGVHGAVEHRRGTLQLIADRVIALA